MFRLGLTSSFEPLELPPLGALEEIRTTAAMLTAGSDTMDIVRFFGTLTELRRAGHPVDVTLDDSHGLVGIYRTGIYEARCSECHGPVAGNRRCHRHDELEEGPPSQVFRLFPNPAPMPITGDLLEAEPAS